MSEVLACSHIFVVSEDLKIVDFGEYSQPRLHVSTSKKGSHFETLKIDQPFTKTQLIFTTQNRKIPITDIFSCSNNNSDCIIMGSVKYRRKTGDITTILITPYDSETVTERINKEVDVLNTLAERGGRYCEEILITKRPNPIVERIKQVQL